MVIRSILFCIKKTANKFYFWLLYWLQLQHCKIKIKDQKILQKNVLELFYYTNETLYIQCIWNIFLCFHNSIWILNWSYIHYRPSPPPRIRLSIVSFSILTLTCNYLSFFSLTLLFSASISLFRNTETQDFLCS